MNNVKFCEIFRYVAGSRLSTLECPREYEHLFSEDKQLLLQMRCREYGNIENFYKVLSDTLVICNSGSESLSMGSSKPWATLYGCGQLGVDGSSDVKGTINRYLGVEVEGSKGERIEGLNFDDEDFEESDSDETQVDEVKEDYSEPVETKEEEDKGVSEEPEKFDAEESSIIKFFSSQLNPKLLLDRYKRMFSDCYEVDTPDGIYCSEGIARVSGSKKTLTVASDEAYYMTYMEDFFQSTSPYVESTHRAYSKIAEELTARYLEMGVNAPTVYFPNKLLEFAYGRVGAKAGQEHDSVNTYEKSSNAASWSAYSSSDLSNNIKNMLNKLVVVYVKNVCESKGLSDFKNRDVIEAVDGFMNYCYRCLSFCILFKDFKVTEDGKPYLIRFRICDAKRQYSTGVNYAEELVGSAFNNIVSEDSFALPIIEDDMQCVIEFGYEFDHTLASVSPLFAYKALQALQRGGMNLSWDNLILGRNEDGSILKNGEGSPVNISGTISHYICAGSRAGKGVLTLNLLASAIASGRPVFYNDNKPDMASLVRSLSPNAYAINAFKYDEKEDFYAMFRSDYRSGLNGLANVPSYASSVLGFAKGNSDIVKETLGTMIYYRSLCLTLGLAQSIYANATSNKALGLTGGKGIVCVIDELNNVDLQFRQLLKNIATKLPPLLSKYEEIISKPPKGVSQEENELQVRNKKFFNTSSYYALALMESMRVGLDSLEILKNAGKNVGMIPFIDLIIIGQDELFTSCQPNPSPSSAMDEILSGRYKMEQSGLSRSSMDALSSEFGATGNYSLLSSMADFGELDVFVGRTNGDMLGGEGNRSSKAYGKVDEKASNFAYRAGRIGIGSRNGKVSTIFEDVVSRGSSAAESMYMFKPYLILNDSAMDSKFVQGMFSRWDKNKIPKSVQENIISSNCEEGNPAVLNRAAGFEDYLALAGINSAQIEQAMGLSGQIAQRLVTEVLGYQGSWLEFLCDFRVEWIFTPQDICTCMERGVGLQGIERSYFSELLVVHPEMLETGYKDPNDVAGEGEYVSSKYDLDSFSDLDEEYEKATSDAKAIFEEEEPEEYSFSDEDVDLDEELDLFGENDAGVQDNFTGESNDIEDTITMSRAELEALLEEYAEYSRQAEMNGGAPKYYEGTNEPIRDYVEQPIQNVASIDLGKEIGSMDFNADDITCTGDLMTKVTEAVYAVYGDFSTYTSLRVVGGILAINDRRFQCKLDVRYAQNIPFDIRIKANSGQVADLFNYGTIYAMSNLQVLECDSETFFGGYIAPQLGCDYDGGCIKTLFQSLPKLKAVKVGKSIYTSENYMQKLEGVGRNYSKMETIAWGGNAFFAKNFKKSKDLASATLRLGKNPASGSNCQKFLAKHGLIRTGVQAVGLAAASAGMLATGAGALATGAIGKGKQVVDGARTVKKTSEAKSQAKAFARGLRDLWNN